MNKISLLTFSLLLAISINADTTKYESLALESESLATESEMFDKEYKRESERLDNESKILDSLFEKVIEEPESEASMKKLDWIIQRGDEIQAEYKKLWDKKIALAKKKTAQEKKESEAARENIRMLEGLETQLKVEK